MRLLPIASLPVLALLAACTSAPSAPTEHRDPPAEARAARRSSPPNLFADLWTDGAADGVTPLQAAHKVPAKPVAHVEPSPDDPLKGKWSLDDATRGLPAGKTLSATLDTDQGPLECKLFDHKAPITVANFVGLARGLRPWKTPSGAWEKRPAYDGTTFHRVIKGFMIQGGDAKKNGTGEAGYVIPDEIWEGGSHDRPGLLCMANRGPNTNSAQFFITDGAPMHLDGGYTIFGECAPVDTVHLLAGVPAEGEHPTAPPIINKVTITRK